MEEVKHKDDKIEFSDFILVLKIRGIPLGLAAILIIFFR